MHPGPGRARKKQPQRVHGLAQCGPGQRSEAPIVMEMTSRYSTATSQTAEVATAIRNEDSAL